VNPTFWQLDEFGQARAVSLLARSLGKLMPLWYALCLALLATAAYIHRHEEALISLLIAMAVWIAVIVYTFSALVPINNRVTSLQPAALLATWRQDHKQWDKLHRWRILLLIAAMACLTYGVLSSQ
jgi:uncharacterized membrane protein